MISKVHVHNIHLLFIIYFVCPPWDAVPLGVYQYVKFILAFEPPPPVGFKSKKKINQVPKS